MRNRRLARCLQRADLAIKEGALEEARSALAEARLLAPESADVAAFEGRLLSLQDGVGESGPGMTPRRRPSAALLAVVSVLVLAAGAVFGGSYWYVASSPVTPIAATTAASESDAGAIVGVPPASPESRRLQIMHETVIAPTATPRIVADVPSLPPTPGPPIAKSAPETLPAVPEQAPVVVALNRPTSSNTMSITEPQSGIPPEPQSGVRLERAPLPLPSAPANSAVAADATAPVPATPAEPRDTRVDAVPTVRKNADDNRDTPSVRDESSLVLGVLQRYELAYSSLDAAAAAAVWPRVNRGALARAFDGLASQRVSLGRCDVAVNGPAAHATCSGSATWKPKIGGGQRTEQRQWDFELRKTGNAWRIERAVAGGLRE